MKGLAIIAAALLLTACKAKEANTVSTDSAAVTAPAATSDTGMAMTHDTAAKDTTKK